MYQWNYLSKVNFSQDVKKRPNGTQYAFFLHKDVQCEFQAI